jgi:hypothetical protein
MHLHYRRRILKETPSFAAITLVAPGERLNAFEIFFTPTLVFASDFNSRTSDAVHVRLTVFFLAIRSSFFEPGLYQCTLSS